MLCSISLSRTVSAPNHGGPHGWSQSTRMPQQARHSGARSNGPSAAQRSTSGAGTRLPPSAAPRAISGHLSIGVRARCNHSRMRESWLVPGCGRKRACTETRRSARSPARRRDGWRAHEAARPSGQIRSSYAQTPIPMITSSRVLADQSLLPIPCRSQPSRYPPSIVAASWAEGKSRPTPDVSFATRRMSQDGRLIMGGAALPRAKAGERLGASAARCGRAIPLLGQVSFTHRWGGRVAIHPNYLPTCTARHREF